MGRLCSSTSQWQQLSVQHKHWLVIPHPICSCGWCLRAFFSWLSCPSLFYPFTQPFSAPVLGACPGLRQGSVCFQHWQAATLPFLAPCPTILETSQLFALLSSDTTIPLWLARVPYRPPGPDRNTLKLLDLQFWQQGEARSVSKVLGRRWSQGEQSLHNAISHFAALGHEIKKGIHCRSLKSFLWSVSWAASCLNSLISPPRFYGFVIRASIEQ